MAQALAYFLLFTGLIPQVVSDCAENGNCCDHYNCEYHVFKKLLKLEDKVASLTEEVEGSHKTIEELRNIVLTYERSSGGSIYIRWGRSSCPNTSSLVYDGYAAGSYYGHSGTAVNPLCLPKDPVYDEHKDGFQDTGRIYGAEYRTSEYSFMKHVNYQDIPCAVCRIPRNIVFMLPGKNMCHANYILEYKGYLMSSYHSHSAAYEFVCVDKNPDSLPGGSGAQIGTLFYMVEASCGLLRCPPYKSGWEITCAVCSYHVNA